MSTTEWFEHFKHKLQGLTESHAVAASPLSLLGYALKENQLAAEEYFPWAMAHYKLPRLQARFFTETPPRKEMYAKWATHYSWTVECLPVAEWDGILVVACLQPPQDFPLNPTAVFVLAPPEALETCWNSWQSESSTAAPSLQKSESSMPEGMVGLNITPAKKSDSFSFEDLGSVGESSNPSIRNSEEESSDSPVEELGGLEGIFDTPVVKLQSISPSDASAEASTPEAVQVASHETTPVDDILNPQEATPAAAQKTFESTVVDTRPVIPSVIPKAGPQGGPPPPPTEDTGDLISEDSFGNKPMAPIVARPTGVAKPTMNPVASGSFLLEKLKKKNNAVIADKVKKVLSEMKAHFEKSMILSLDEQESQVTAFAWDENFQDIKDTSLRVPLKTPSIFNIVASTQKPFHGYISLNEMNEKFFEQWNQGAIPDHVTITPIVVNEKIVGMLMGFAEKSAYNKVSLTLAEKLSNEFTKGLQAA